MGKLTRLSARAFGRNPLLRPSDRLEAALILLLVAAFLALAPFVTALAVHHANAAAQRQLRQEASWHRTTATLLQDAVCTVPGCTTAPVLARWTAAGGHQRTGTVSVSVTAKAGELVPVWMNPSGQVASGRLTAVQIRDRTDLVAATVPVGLALALVGAGVVLRVVRFRQDVGRWGRAWDATEPQWSRRR